MVIDLAEDPDKSTSGPAKLTEEVMGIMCRWVQASESDCLQKVGCRDINLIWSGLFGEGLQMGATLKLGQQGLRFLCGKEAGRLLVDNSFRSHKRAGNSQTLNSGFLEKVFEAAVRPTQCS